MFELIKKTLLTGVGLAVMTKDKVEELGKELASQAKLSEHEGKEFVDHLLKQSETARKEFETRISAAVQKAVSGLNLASKDEVARLSAKVEELSARLSKDGSGYTRLKWPTRQRRGRDPRQRESGSRDPRRTLCCGKVSRPTARARRFRTKCSRLRVGALDRRRAWNPRRSRRRAWRGCPRTRA